MRRILWIGSMSCILFSACTSSRQIYQDGLKHIKIGDEMLEEGTRRFKGRAVRDTLLVEQGYTWRASIIEYPDGGSIILEEDFQGNGKINRIRVESRSLNFKKEISTQQKASTLLELGKNWDITYLTTYKLLDFNLSRFPSLHFLVKEPRPRESSASFQKLKMEDLSPEATIVSIVIM